MILKIINPKKDGKNLYQNNGSCFSLVQYLSKEDDKLGDDREYFFNHDNDIVMASEVLSTIDSYRKGLEKKDTKFYSLVIAPTDAELSCMKDPRKELRDYTRMMMEIYAENFKGITKAKNLKGKDIEYFAKIEFDRHYKGSDKEVIDGTVEQGSVKPGNNMHVHIIVSRKDKSNEHKISPLVNNKKAFHIEGLKLKACYKLDEIYLFDTSAKELEAMMIKRDGNDLGVKAYESYKPNVKAHEDSQKKNVSTEVAIASISEILFQGLNSPIESESQSIDEDVEKIKKKKKEEKGRGFKF